MSSQHLPDPRLTESQFLQQFHPQQQSNHHITSTKHFVLLCSPYKNKLLKRYNYTAHNNTLKVTWQIWSVVDFLVFKQSNLLAKRAESLKGDMKSINPEIALFHSKSNNRCTAPDSVFLPLYQTSGRGRLPLKIKQLWHSSICNVFSQYLYIKKSFTASLKL